MNDQKNTLLFIALSAAILVGLTLPVTAPTTDAPAISALAAVKEEMRDGLRIVWSNPIVRGTAAVEALWQLVFSALFVAALVYVEESLHLGAEAPTAFSILTACFAGGTAIGALVARPGPRTPSWRLTSLAAPSSPLPPIGNTAEVPP